MAIFSQSFKSMRIDYRYKYAHTLLDNVSKVKDGKAYHTLQIDYGSSAGRKTIGA